MNRRLTQNFQYFVSIILWVVCAQGYASVGKIIDPIHDICWQCIMPITIHADAKHGPQDIGCLCPGVIPKAGIPISFWEPTRLVDVTRHAYRLIGLGGIAIGRESIKNRGSLGLIEDGSSVSGFYQVHWYNFPVLAWLGMLTDFSSCLDTTSLDLGYMTELDPTWNDDELSLILNGEAALFSNPLAVLSCIEDCRSASANKPKDKLFWCAGCLGSLYPFTGNVSHVQGGIQTSALLVQRMIAKLHRSHLLKVFDTHDFCEGAYLPLIKKSTYKLQLIHPVAMSQGPCVNLGQTTAVWGSGKSFPYKGEDFVYLIWTKKQCCLDVIKPVVGGAL